MPSPSQLSIAASSVNRLLKEETTYRTELANQERHLEQTQGKAETEEDEGNRDFNIKQEVYLLLEICACALRSVPISFQSLGVKNLHQKIRQGMRKF